MGFLSPDGVCHSFDERANEYARGEGFAALILKPLSSALRDGDTVRAVICATRSNQNGLTSLTQRSKEARIRLIEETYPRARLDMTVTRFVEAHGTETQLRRGPSARLLNDGEPRATLSSCEFPRHVPRPTMSLSMEKNSLTHSCHLGGHQKVNIGHCEGASGIAGVVKTILVLESGVIPPIANLGTLTPAIFLYLKVGKFLVSFIQMNKLG